MPNNKRLIFITGDKGGVGKSFTARALTQFLIDSQRAFWAFDIDPVNPNLFQFYAEYTTPINILETGALDKIRNDLDSNSLLLVDCAARALNELDIWFKELGLLQQRKNLNLAITFVFVITPDKSCTFIMSDALERFGTEADYVVVKNTAKGKNFSIYENSQLRKKLLAAYQGKEITLPALLERTVVLLDTNDIGFGQAFTDSRTTSADRSRVRGFLDQTYDQFKTVEERLT